MNHIAREWASSLVSGSKGAKRPMCVARLAQGYSFALVTTFFHAMSSAA